MCPFSSRRQAEWTSVQASCYLVYSSPYLLYPCILNYWSMPAESADSHYFRQQNRNVYVLFTQLVRCAWELRSNDVCGVSPSVYPHRASWRIYLTAVAIKPTTFEVLARSYDNIKLNLTTLSGRFKHVIFRNWVSRINAVLNIIIFILCPCTILCAHL